MIGIDTRQLEEVRDGMTPEVTFVDALYEIVRALPAIQDKWFSGGGASGFRQLSPATIALRSRGKGYYATAPASGVSASAPFGKSTGNTLNHTTGIMGRLQVRVGIAVLEHDLKRWWVLNWWDEKEIERQLEAIVDRRWQRIFDRQSVERSLRAA